MKTIFLIFLLLTCVVLVNPDIKNTGWQKGGLKGKVKEQIQFIYRFEKKIKILDEKTISKFNDKGNPTEIEWYYNFDGSLGDRFIYQYDTNGNIAEKEIFRIC